MNGASIIFLTQNNYQQLDSFFSNFLKVNIHEPVEFIIIDHGSTDSTPNIVSRYSSKSFIRLINRSANHSPESSANLGAKKSENSSLLFLSPHAHYPDDFYTQILNTEPDAKEGIIFNISLFDKSNPHLRSYHQSLKDILLEGIVEIENRALPNYRFGNLGNILFCKKDDFNKLGGFSNEYRQRIEDPDFYQRKCLKTESSSCEDDDGSNSTDLDFYDETSSPISTQNCKDIKIIFEDNIVISKWEKWEISDAFAKQKNGSLKCDIKGNHQCAFKTNIDISPDSYYILYFKYKIISQKAKLYWIIRDSNTSGAVNFYNGNQAPVMMYYSDSYNYKESSIIFRSFCHTSHLDLHLFAKDIQPDDQICISKIKLSKLSAEDVCIKPVFPQGEKIFASLASIPGRENVLKDVVRSLYHQVDEIRVFLNGYKSIPSFLLNDPKIVVERSQIWGDNGDAGKFFWVDDPTPGYRFICDDDIIYPVNYAYSMIKKLQEYKHEVVAGIHGILLKQPLRNYYNKNFRHVSHYRSQINHDYSCHVLGTGAIAYHTKTIQLSYNDFQFRNMADIWLTKNAQEQKIPLVCISRPHNWVMPQDSAVEHSIYTHSTSDEESSLNTKSIQSHVVRDLHPVTIYPPQKSRKKVIFAVKTYNRQEYLKECLESFLATKSLDFDWVVIVADDGSTDGTLEYLDKVKIPHELHIIKNHRRYAVGQCNTIFELSKRIGFDYGFNVDDDMFFTKPGWDHLYIKAINSSGYSHLVHRHLEHALNLKRKCKPQFELPEPEQDKSKTCVSHGDAWFDLGTGSLFTFTPDTLKTVGYCDEKNFPIRGQWHGDYHIRCCRAGFNDINNLFDAAGSNEYIEIQNYKADCYRCAIPWGEEYKKTKNPQELNRRYAVMGDNNRIYIPSPNDSRHHIRGGDTLNSFFDKIYVLNLDRRPDRWNRVKASADKFDIKLERFTAVDGSKTPYIDKYQEYIKKDFVQVPKEFQISSNYEFYRKYPSDISRVAYFEKRNQCKAIGSPGAWGYLLTMINILQDALKNEHERILVLDDDVIFHKDFSILFKNILKQVPNDWLILQLGALQYHWEDEWIKWYSENLYMCNGCSLGSHAVGMHRSVIPLVLNHCLRFDLPYDEGPLHKPKALYPKKCLTFYPNLLIQDVSESDISDKTGQKKAMAKKENIYRWDLSNYNFYDDLLLSCSEIQDAKITITDSRKDVTIDSSNQFAPTMRLQSSIEPSSNPVRCRRRFDVIKKFMKQGDIGAELGVFKGNFIDYLLSTKPSKLYAVDPWYRLSSEWPWAKGDKSTLRAFHSILKEFESELKEGILEPRVEFSQEFLSSLPDDHLDWVYIDSSHMYEKTLEELELCIKKVKVTGFIMGDDYNPDPSHRHHGVCKAVKEFENKAKLKLLVEGQGGQFVAQRVQEVESNNNTINLFWSYFNKIHADPLPYKDMDKIEKMIQHNDISKSLDAIIKETKRLNNLSDIKFSKIFTKKEYLSFKQFFEKFSTDEGYLTDFVKSTINEDGKKFNIPDPLNKDKTAKCNSSLCFQSHIVYIFNADNYIFYFFSSFFGSSAIYFPHKSFAIGYSSAFKNFNNLLNELIYYILSNAKKIRKYVFSKNSWLGLFVSHHRPAHYFYESLPALWLLKHNKLLNNKPSFIALEGQNFFPLDTIFDNKCPSLLFKNSNMLNEYLIKNNYFIIGCCTTREFFFKYEKLNKQLDKNLVKASKQIADNSDFSKIISQTKVKSPLVWLGITGQKRAWIEQIECLSLLASHIFEKYPNCSIIFDGWTKPLNPSSHDQLQIANDQKVFNKITKNINSKIYVLSLIGAYSWQKIAFASLVDLFLTNSSTGSLFVDRIAQKIGIIHTNTLGVGSGDRQVHYYSQTIPQKYVINIDHENKSPQHVSYSIKCDIVLDYVMQALNKVARSHVSK